MGDCFRLFLIFLPTDPLSSHPQTVGLLAKSSKKKATMDNPPTQWRGIILLNVLKYKELKDQSSLTIFNVYSSLDLHCARNLARLYPEVCGRSRDARTIPTMPKRLLASRTRRNFLAPQTPSVADTSPYHAVLCSHKSLSPRYQHPSLQPPQQGQSCVCKGVRGAYTE